MLSPTFNLLRPFTANSDGSVKLCDFGLAIDTSLEVPVSRVGTSEYMAPELVRLDPSLSLADTDALCRSLSAQYTAKVRPSVRLLREATPVSR